MKEVPQNGHSLLNENRDHGRLLYRWTDGACTEAGIRLLECTKLYTWVCAIKSLIHSWRYSYKWVDGMTLWESEWIDEQVRRQARETERALILTHRALYAGSIFLPAQAADKVPTSELEKETNNNFITIIHTHSINLPRNGKASTNNIDSFNNT